MGKAMVKLTYRKKVWELRAGMTVRDAILKCGLNPEQVLAVRNGKLIHEATILKEQDEIKLVAVISGGVG
jgi:sulfur carrier protein ThiS